MARCLSRRTLTLVVAALALPVAGCGKTTRTVVERPNILGALFNGGRVYRVPSGSMEPTLPIGSRVLVEPLKGEPHIGDIVIFNPPEDADIQVCGPTPHRIREGADAAACDQPEPARASVKFVKRVVAGPGDAISIVEGHVIRNGKPEKDPYIRQCKARSPQCNFPTPIKIPTGDWYMLGDNRGESDDSRFWGPVPRAWILGRMQCSFAEPNCPRT